MQNYYVRDIVKATGGTLLCGNLDQLVETVSTDSNTIGEKALFVPIIGEKVDAHRFIDSAIAGGAVAVLTSEHDDMEGDVPYITIYCSPLPMGRLCVLSNAVMENGEGENSRTDSPLLAMGIL